MSTETTAVEPLEDGEPTVLERAQEILSRLSARRWRLLQVRFDTPINELTKDPVLQLVIMAHEHWRVTSQENGDPVRDEWDRFEDMSIGELNEYLGITGAARKSAAAVPAV